MAASSVSVLDSAGTARTLATFTNAAGAQAYQVSGDSAIAHYSASKSLLTPVATPTAVCILAGNATTTVRLKRIVLNGIATSAGSMKFSVKKNSDAGTLGSAALTSLTAVPHDSSATAASSTLKTVGTANYTTLPALVAAIYSSQLEMGAAGAGVFNQVQIDFGVGGMQAVVLRGTAESVTVDFLGDAIPSGGKLDITYVWAEDAS